MTADNRFRRQIAESLDKWVADALITDLQRDRFREYYKLDRLNLEANSRFTIVLLTIGALLVGLGAISFVAANWDRLLPSVRAVGVLALMLMFDVSGYWLLRGSGRSKNHQRLGSALLLIGQLMLGASIGLMAQWFQVGGSPTGLYFWWGLGVLGVACSVRHNLSAVLAIWLLQMSWYEMPILLDLSLLLVVCLPLAYWCRSRWVFAAVMLSTNVSVVSVILEGSSFSSSETSYWFWLAYIALTSAWWVFSLVHPRILPRILDWLPSDSFGSNLLADGTRQDDASLARRDDLDFGPFARILSMLGLLGGLFFLSSSWLYRWDDDWPLTNFFDVFARAPGITGMIWGLVLLSLGLWVWVICDRRQTSTRTSTLDWTVGAISAASILLLHMGMPWENTVLVFNLLLFGLACMLAWQGLRLGVRWYYWMGLLAVTLQILIRFFEYDTGLLLKSVVLIVCGISTMAAGISFERRLQHSPAIARLPE